jgi:hypothetical protein
MEQLHDTREGWLSHALALISKRFTAQGYSLPANVKIACGFPVGSRGGKKILGQAISQKASAAGYHETFVSPLVDNPMLALGVVAHEYGHHSVGIEAGHGAQFKQFCAAVGLEGKATEALPGAALKQWLQDEVLPMLGEYPHAAVDPSQRKKQSTRMIKLICPETGYTVRTTKKWLALGVPTSPAGCEMVVQGDEDEGED